jgi:hypothetical protein
MLGQLIESLDDPAVASALLSALDDPAILARLSAAAEAEGEAPADILASNVRGFIETASDDLWTQLIGIMSRSENPGLTAVRAILNKTLPPSPA